jgi:UDP:flavonoid glycosyltransferase YjiC (YdhE family)
MQTWLPRSAHHIEDERRTMRILFSSVTAAGHLLPLADAASGAGHDVAFLTGADMAEYLGSRTLLPAGPGSAELRAESQRRTGGGDPRHAGEAAVMLFTDARIDLTHDEALDQARRFAPDLLVCEELDFVGPLVAAALDVPWAAHAITAPLPAEFYELVLARADAHRIARGLPQLQRVALVDPLPDVFRRPADPPLPADRIATRTVAYAGDRISAAAPELPVGRPLVLVSGGTSVREPTLLGGLAVSVAEEGFEVVVTVEPDTVPAASRVHEIGFVPLARVLPELDALVCTAGMGTVQAALAAGVPLVLRPMIADQHWNAQRVASAGAGLVIDSPGEAGAAVRTVLTEPKYREAAQAAAAAIRSMPAPEVALADLLVKAGLPTLA